MPLDAELFALPAYEEAYVDSAFVRLLPGAIDAQNQHIMTRTRFNWQLQMSRYVFATGVDDPLMPTYEKAYVQEAYTRLLPGARAAFNRYILLHTPAPWQASMQTRIDSWAVIDIDVASYASAVVAGGGSFSDTYQNVLSWFVAAEKAAGTWALTDDYWVMWGENNAQAVISLKQKRTITPVASPKFVAGQGFAYDGVASCHDSNFICQTHKVAMAQDNLRMATFLTNDITTGSFMMGVNSGSTRTMRFRPHTSAQAGSFEANCGASNTSQPDRSGKAFFAASRSAATAAATLGWKNGTVLVRTLDPTVFASTGLPIHSMFFGCANNVGTAGNFAANQVGFIALGAAFTTAQEAAQYRNVITMARTLSVV